MLTISNITYRIQGRPLFEGASLVLPDGAKAGKTSVVRSEETKDRHTMN